MTAEGANSQNSASRERTICILLGSSEYPGDPMNNKLFMRDALRRSYRDFLRYLLGPEGMSLSRRNVLSLFGSGKSYVDQLDSIDAFLDRRERTLASAGGKPVDLIIFFWGHGYFAGNEFHLALKAYAPEKADRTGIPISKLANSIRSKIANARRYWLLDCCYADGALSAALGPDASTAVASAATHVDLAKSIMAPDFAALTGGSTALTAADRDNKAWVFKRDSRSLFTDLLMSALAKGGAGTTQFCLHDIEQRMQEILQERRSDRIQFPDYHDQIVPPRCHDPDRKSGLVSRIPLFPRLAAIKREPRRRVEELLTLDPKALTFLLVEAETKSSTFETEAFNGIVEKESEIEKEARGPDADTEDFPRFNAETQVKSLSIADAFHSWPQFQTCIKVLCRADVVVFDVTDFQPGIMLLLGIRSVVRRGVTVCSIDSPSLEAYRAPLPYCVQVLNVCSHSLAGPDRDRYAPHEIIAHKIVEGLRQKRTNPYYLDLPAYDSVRRLGTRIEHYRPIPYQEQVLFLCPFSPEYVEHCWDASVGRFFRSRLIAHHNNAVRAQRRQHQKAPEPQMRRLLDRGSPQIVSQSLYEAVRRTQMCIADWTNLRPNLFFELGVRLACNPLGAVQIVADGVVNKAAAAAFHATGSNWGAWPSDEIAAAEVAVTATLKQVNQLQERFRPLTYPVGMPSDTSYDAMVARHMKNASLAETDDNRVYRTIADFLPRIGRTDIEPNVEEELLQRATMLGGKDDFNKFTTVLHADANPTAREAGEKAALERKVAAWLYLDGRYAPSEIASDEARYLRYQTLYVAIARDGISQFPQALIDRVEAGYNSVLKEGPAIADKPFGLFDKGIENLLNISKLRKGRGDIDGAINVLRDAIARLDDSSWPVSARQQDPTWEDKIVASRLTDAYGMIGGHYRRWNQPKDALANFNEGRQFEKNAHFDIESTYNTVNWLVTKIELEPVSYPAIAHDVDAAIALLDRHTKGSRNQDAWAWADLATCQTLSSQSAEVDRAPDSLRKFTTLCDRESVGVPVRVLETLHASLSIAGLHQSENVKRIIEWFHNLRGSTR